MSEKVAKAARKMARELEDSREEILTAFVSKFGFQPDECEQVLSDDGKSWCVVRLDPEKLARVTRAIVVSRLAQKRWGRWQRFCLWLARI